jgi:phospholipase C
MPGTDHAAAGFDPIRHVVVLMLENRSYDMILGGLAEAIPDSDGVPPGSARHNFDPQGRAYYQLPTRTNRVDPDPAHENRNVLAQLARGNAGFVRDYATRFPETNDAQRADIMGYFPRGFMRATHGLAERFAICDRWFSSVPGPTWTNRLFALSGTSLGWVEMPSLTSLQHMHNYNQDTIFDRLNERGVSWKVYHGDFPLSLLLTHQLRPWNLRRYEWLRNFGRDASRADFPSFVFIEPNYIFQENDDHPPHDSQATQGLVGHVFNVLRRNAALWSKVLLVVLYDEHGGFYDHVSPPDAVPPDAHRQEYAFDRLGVRVPAIFVSPWLEAQVVHEGFDHTSLLKYLADKWGLRMLGRRMEEARNPWPFLKKSAGMRGDIPLTIAAFAQALLPRPATAAGLSELREGILAYSRQLENRLRPSERFGGPAFSTRITMARDLIMRRLEGFMAARQ